MDIFEEIKSLNFPQDQYMIIGGAVMAVHGIRQAEDVDILVTPQLFESCKQNGWQELQWTKPGKEGKSWLKRGAIELYSEILFENKNLQLNDLRNDVELVFGVPFLKLSRLLDFKKEYARLYNRPKDFEDIVQIKAKLLTTV